MRTRENFPVGYPSQIAPSQARLTWRIFRDRLPKKKMHLIGMDTLLILLTLGHDITFPLPWYHNDILALGDGDILAQGLIELIEYSYQQGASSFSEAYLERTSKLSVIGLEQFGMTDRPESFIGCAWVRTKSAQKTRVGLWGRYMILKSF
jgi:hypothetical protein